MKCWTILAFVRISQRPLLLCKKEQKYCPEAFESLFDLFYEKNFRNREIRNILWIQTFSCRRFGFSYCGQNPDDPILTFRGTENQNRIILLHLNALYTMLFNIYMSTLNSKRADVLMNAALLVGMTDRSLLKSVLLLADRGYELLQCSCSYSGKGLEIFVPYQKR